MFNVLAVIFGVAAIVVYMKAVKYEKSWGTPVMTLLVVAAFVSVILPYTGLTRGIERRRMERLMYGHIEDMGSIVSQDLSPDARVLLLVDYIEYDEVVEALESGLGFSVEVVGDAAPVRDVRRYNQAINEHRNNVDLILSLTGIPVLERDPIVYGLEQLDFYGWDDIPVFVADVGSLYNAEMLRDYIQDGLLGAVSIYFVETDTRKVVGPDNVDDLSDL